MDPEIVELLKILGLKNPVKTDMKMKIISSQYKKMSLIKHPDKKGGTKEDFQELLAAYEKLGKIISDSPQEDPKDEEETSARELFNTFNFAKENIESITIFIESNMVTHWEGVLCDKFGDPIDRSEEVTGKNNGKQWVDKAFHVETESGTSKVYITIWDKKNKEHSTMLIQCEKSMQFLNVSYVNNVIPVLYKEAVEKRRKETPSSSTKKRVKTKSVSKSPRVTRTTKKEPKKFPCKSCDFQTTNVSQLNIHNKTSHANEHANKILKPMLSLGRSISQLLPLNTQMIPLTGGISKHLNCYICGDGFANVEEVSKHIKEGHQTETPVTKNGDKASKQDESSSLMEQSVPKESETETTLEVISIQQVDNGRGDSNISNHDEERTAQGLNNKCEECKYEAKDISQLNSHMKIVHNKNPKLTIVKIPTVANPNEMEVSNISKPIHCYVCGKGFDEVDMLSEHEREEHVFPTSSTVLVVDVVSESSEENDVKETSIHVEGDETMDFENFNWSESGEEAGNKSVIQMNCKFVCEKCDQRFEKQLHLEEHIYTEHKASKVVESNIEPSADDKSGKEVSKPLLKVQCSMCEKTYEQQTDLEEHIEAEHCGEICSEKQTQTEQLNCINCVNLTQNMQHFETLQKEHKELLNLYERQKSICNDQLKEVAELKEEREKHALEKQEEVNETVRLKRVIAKNEKDSNSKINDLESKVRECYQTVDKYAQENVKLLEERKMLEEILDINQMLKEHAENEVNEEGTTDKVIAEVITLQDNEDPFDDAVIESYLQQANEDSNSDENYEQEAEVIELSENEDPDDDDVIEFYLNQKINRASRTCPSAQASTNKDTVNQGTKKAPLPFKCNLCNFKAKSQTDINLHKEAQHAVNTVKCCEMCGFRYETDIQLQKHIKVAHSKEKRPCRYWDNGACFNGNECRFSHKTKQSQNPNQKPCFYQDYCRNPNCPFAHVEGGNFEQHFLWNQNSGQPRSWIN